MDQNGLKPAEVLNKKRKMEKMIKMLSLLKNLVVLLVILLIGSPVWADKNRAQYVPDLVVTEPGAIFTDMRAWGTNNAAFGDALSDIGTTPTTLVISEDVTITDVQLVESNTTLKFVNGAKIILTDSATLSILGTIDAGRHQIFQDNATTDPADTTLGFTEFQRGLVTFSNSTYIPVDGGTPAYISTVGNNLQDYVLPEWWGATANSTDGNATTNTTAFNDALKSTCRMVKVFPGMYKIENELKFQMSGQSIVGETTNTEYPYIWNIASTPILHTNSKSNCSIKNLRLAYQNTTHSASSITSTSISAFAIFIYESHQTLVSNVKIDNSYVGIKLVDSLSCSLELLKINSFFYSAIFATDTASEAMVEGELQQYRTHGCDDLHITDFIIAGGNKLNCGWVKSTAATPTYQPFNDPNTCATGGTYATDTSDSEKYGTGGAFRFIGKVPALKISNGDIVISRYAMVMENNGLTNPQQFDKPGGFFEKVYFDTAWDGTFINDSAMVTFVSCGFASNAGSYNADAAPPSLYVVASESLKIIGSEIYNSSGHGLRIGPNVHNAVISDNSFVSIGGQYRYDTYTDPTFAGIHIDANTDNFIITNNEFHTNTDFYTGNMDYGVEINNGGSENYIIANNNFGQRRTVTANPIPPGTTAIYDTYTVAAIYDGGNTAASTTKKLNNNINDEDDLKGGATGGILTIPPDCEFFTVDTAGTIDHIYGSISGVAYFPRGHLLTLYFTVSVTVSDVAGLDLASSFSATAGDTLMLVADGTGWWREINRSNN